MNFAGTPDADFGTVAGQQTVAEVKDLFNLWDTRMSQMTDGYNKIKSQWMTVNASEHSDWLADFNNLQNRYNKAKGDAQKAISDSGWNPLPDSMIPMQDGYDNISKAMRQNYPPDGATVQKGDWIDLFDRLNKAGSEIANYKSSSGGQGSLVVDNPPQPTAPDADLQIIQKTDPVAVIVNDFAKIIKWMKDHPKTSVGIGLVVVGGIGYPYLKLITAPVRAVVGM